MKKLLFLAVCCLLTIAATAQTKAKAPKEKSAQKALPKKKKAKEHIVELTTDYGKVLIRLYNETPLHRDNFLKLAKQGFFDSLLFHRVIKSFMIQGGDPQSKNADSAAMLGNGDVGYKIPAEIVPGLFHRRGALAAARDNNPMKESSGCQFYIVHGKVFTKEELENVMNGKNFSRKQEMLYKIYQSDTVQAVVSALQNSGNKDAVKSYTDDLRKIVDDMYDKAPKTNFSFEQINTYMTLGGAPHLDGDYTVFGEVLSGLEVIDKIANVPTGQADRPLKNVRMKIRVLR